MSKIIFSNIFGKYLKSKYKEILFFIQNPFLVQERVFWYLIKKTKNTYWGKKYSYKNIKSIKDFQKKVPLSTYEDIFPYIQKMLNGEKDILWPGKINWFAKSSGTTNDKSKFIPVSKDCLKKNHFKGGKYTMSLYFNLFPNSKIFKGQSLFITGSFADISSNSDIKAGDISAVMLHHSPIWLHSVRVPEKKIAFLSKWEEKAEFIIKNAKKYNITSIYGTPTWVLFLIERITKEYDVKSIFEIWPNLEVFFHGAVSFVPYRSVFKKLISPQIRYMEIYNATEGFFAIQDKMDRHGEMLLLLDVGIFYEFIPMEVFGTSQQYAISLDQVEMNKNYALVITTNSGLARYIIGDTIKFTSIKPFRIKITGRTKHFINAFGEEVVIENVEESIKEACSITGATVKTFTVAPFFMQEGKGGYHEWVIEFIHQPEDEGAFFRLIDENLQKLNSDYEAKRAGSVILGAPIFHIAPQGTFYKWMKKRGKFGGQHKIPRLSNDRKFIEEILDLIKSA